MVFGSFSPGLLSVAHVDPVTLKQRSCSNELCVTDPPVVARVDFVEGNPVNIVLVQVLKQETELAPLHVIVRVSSRP